MTGKGNDGKGPFLTKDKIDALPSERLDPAKMDLRQGSPVSPSAVSEMKRINALNLEPAQPRSDGGSSKGPGGKQSAMQMRSGQSPNLSFQELKREFEKSKVDISRRMDNAGADGGKGLEGKRSALNANATAFTPTNAGSRDSDRGALKVGDSGSAPSFNLPGPTKGGSPATMGHILESFKDKCKLHNPSTDLFDWSEARGSSYRDVFGNPTQPLPPMSQQSGGPFGMPGVPAGPAGAMCGGPGHTPCGQMGCGWQQQQQQQPPPPPQPPQNPQHQGRGGGKRGGEQGQPLQQQQQQQQQQQPPQPPNQQQHQQQMPYMMANGPMLQGNYQNQMMGMYGGTQGGPHMQGRMDHGQGPQMMGGQPMVFNQQGQMMPGGPGGFMPMMMPMQGNGEAPKFGGPQGNPQQMMMPMVMSAEQGQQMAFMPQGCVPMQMQGGMQPQQQ